MEDDISDCADTSIATFANLWVIRVIVYPSSKPHSFEAVTYGNIVVRLFQDSDGAILVSLEGC